MDVVKLTEELWSWSGLWTKFGRGHRYRQNFGRGQDNRQIEYIMNPQKENSQTDKKSENVGRGRGRGRPLRSEVTTKQSSIQGSIGVSSAAQEACSRHDNFVMCNNPKTT
jgi:hypothetical protein